MSYIVQINIATLFLFFFSVGAVLCIHVRDGFVRVHARAELSTSGLIRAGSLHWWRLLVQAEGCSPPRVIVLVVLTLWMPNHEEVSSMLRLFSEFVF
jgi:hypothetical protein